MDAKTPLKVNQKGAPKDVKSEAKRDAKAVENGLILM